MPRKTKETDNKTELKTVATKKVSAKVTPEVETKKATKSSAKKSTASSKVATGQRKTSTTKKAATSAKKAEAKKTAVSSKKTAAKKASASAKKTASKKASGSKSKAISYSPEYYDLPYRYNKTVVKLLAQTPTNLFVYWEISDEDRENLKKQFGNYFFEITKPVLIIHNVTMNYSFEIDINDFANSWYIHVDDSKCEYQIELGRRPIPVNYNYIPQYDVKKDGEIKAVETPYIYISSSNALETPNNKILFNSKKIYFRNLKTNEIIEKDITDFPFINKNNKFVNISELYQELYKEEITNSNFDLNNPSSGNLSSGSLSSRFK